MATTHQTEVRTVISDGLLNKGTQSLYSVPMVGGRCLKYVFSPVMGTQRLIAARGFGGCLDHSDKMSVNARSSVVGDSKDGHHSDVPADCCRL
ncbi:hypothetical protein AVEN_185072-1 [Araneus ventricosus]|uniref:Uncharacterized protein n=1 Tax=Araneus ventricosus TaxID=182803 RepID=A0A4Y2BPJ0_ARAVE|nr:hypothetical protein AVEN_185072-1 [Araneus ventricosus]